MIAGLVRQAKADGVAVPCRKVVNISSVAGLGGNAGQVNYAAAKAGVTGLTKTMAREWGRYNVTVNTVAFGLIRTRLTERPRVTAPRSPCRAVRSRSGSIPSC